MVEQAIQHRCHRGVVPEKFAPVFYWPIGGEERAGPLVPAHRQLEEVFRRGAGELAHSKVIDNEQRDFRQQLEVQSSAAIQLRVGKFLQQVMSLAVEDAMALLLDGRPSDGLSDVTLSRAWGPKEEGVLLFVDEFCGGELMDELAIHFFVEVKVEVGKRFFGVSKLRLFQSSSNEAVRPTAQLIRDEGREKIDRSELL